ncbi:MAG: hypothetical protein SXG53_22285 [Pseudomonadota bacterium]|nr:hypothetical protein [Pseudomonadota bacterium]
MINEPFGCEISLRVAWGRERLMSESNKRHELLLARNSALTTALIVLVFGLAIALGTGSNKLVALGYIEKDSVDYLCYQIVALVVKLCESAAIIGIVVAHTVATLAKAIRHMIDVIREALET